MLKKSLVAIASAVAITLSATAAYAGPPQETEDPFFILLYPDLGVNKSVFINITAKEFCDWVPPEGEEPSGPPPAIDTVTSTEIETRKGAIVSKLDADDLYIEMWEFDEDPSPLEGPCEDIQDQLDADADPWATGTASYKATDNDLFGSGTRGNAFGDRVMAILTDQEDNSFSYNSLFRINNRCHAPEFAPPSCLIEKSKLRMF